MFLVVLAVAVTNAIKLHKIYSKYNLNNYNNYNSNKRLLALTGFLIKVKGYIKKRNFLSTTSLKFLKKKA